ncbi:MAG: sulfite exporter TauE/SafE family protein [Variibacter sp.]|nr:sulfite exporter TauE/SafE family protein [Variibacter sp.]
MPDGTTMLLIACGAFFVAGMVKGIIGMGLPTVAIGLLSLMMPPAQAAALFIAPAFITNVWQSFAGPALIPLLRRLGSFFVASSIGIWLGAGLLTGADTRYATSALGVCLSLYAIAGLVAVPFRVPRRSEPWLTPLVGLVTGLVAGATGVFVIPGVPYLQALGLSRDELIQSLGLSFMISTLMLGLVLAKAGIFSLNVAGISLLVVVPSIIGMYAGQVVRRRVRPEVFRTCFFLGMLALGIHLGLRIVL